MSLKVETVWTAIKALSVTSLTIKDIGEVTEAYEIRGAVLFPLIDNPVTIAAPKRQSFGIGSVAKKDVNYTLNYRLLYAPVGSERGVKEIYSNMFVMVANLFNAVVNNDALSGTIDIQPRIASTSTTVKDPAGSSFYGLDISLDVLEYYEV